MLFLLRLILFVFFASCTVVYSQNDSIMLWRAGIFGSYNINRHSADFRGLPGIPSCCPQYSTGQGTGLSVGVLAEIVPDSNWAVALRAGYTTFDAVLSSREQVLLTGMVDGIIEHRIDSRFSLMGLEPSFAWRAFGRFDLQAGVQAGMIIRSRFSQREELTEPDEGTFENGERIRFSHPEQDIPEAASMFVALTGRIGYELPLNRRQTLVAVPEISYSHGLTPLVSGLEWTAHVLKFGLALKYTLNPPLPVVREKQIHTDTLIRAVPPDAIARSAEGMETRYSDTTTTAEAIVITEHILRTDTVFVPDRPVVQARLVSEAVYPDGSRKPVATIGVQTRYVTEAFPVLPVVFFDHQSDQIPQRYNRITSPDQFRPERMAPQWMEIYHNVLNILGERMRTNKSYRITLRGTADPSTEAGDCALAARRAEAVRQYLVSVWSIDPARIGMAPVTGSCAPVRPTRSQTESGYAENRRVEIMSDDADLMAAVVRQQFLEVQTITPPVIEHNPAGSSRKYIRNWSMTVRQGSTEYMRQEGTGAPDIVRQTLTPAQALRLSDTEPLRVELALHAVQDAQDAAVYEIVVARDTSEVELKRLTLTLFDVARDEISRNEQIQLRAFASEISPGAEVKVTGYADLTGNPDFNRDLSQRRADAVCALLQKSIGNSRVSIRCNELAIGSYPPGIDSNTLPEERFLSRTVQVEISRKP